MKEITLVTAYFNVGRGNWGSYSRGDEQYLSYFKHWARLQNRLIVYTSPELADSVQKIRSQYGLDDRTIIIPVPDVFNVQPHLYHVIQQVMKNQDSWLFHKKLDHPESWNYNYNYITNLKAFWVQDAIEKGLSSDFTAWIDFGYDHGGEEFPYSEDFNFLWEYNFTPHIHIFLAKPLDEKPIFKIVHDMDTYLRGGIIVAPTSLWRSFWNDIHESLLSLAECGMADDDQTLFLMAYRRHPEKFQTHLTTYWGEPLRAYGGQTLRIRLRSQKSSNTLHKKLKKWLYGKKVIWDIYHRNGKSLYKDFFQR